MMSNFDIAIQVILLHEGLYVNDPNDPGGATNFGVSLRWLRSIGDLDRDGHPDGDIDLDGDVDVEDVRNMGQEDAVRLYRMYWWDKYLYWKILSPDIATKVFDLSVNMGFKQSHRCLQRAVRSATGTKLEEDGILGNKTFEFINKANDLNLLCAFRSEAAGFYRSLKKPLYMSGWLNRAYS